VTFGWGVEEWGDGPWGGFGGEASGPLTVQGALATSTNTVLVTLTAPPLVMSPIGTGDALNPGTWFVTRSDTGFAFTVIAVRQVDAYQFELRTLEILAGWRVTHTAGSSTLTDGAGNPLSPPTTATFPGVEAAAAPLTSAGVVDVDVANPQAPLQGTAGTLPATAAGDYATESGAALADKLITRALTTKLGGFFHLPNYGFGLGPKQNVTPASLGRLKADAVRIVEAIPMIDSADVVVSFDNAMGILSFTTNAILRNTGQSVQVINRVPTRGVQL
jgi:hypothetical protein